MRVKQPEPFDPNREYSPGERCVYRGMVLIAEIWTAADARLANNNPAIFTQRCVRCKIKREDCPGIGRQCDKFHRSDRKTIYWRLLLKLPICLMSCSEQTLRPVAGKWRKNLTSTKRQLNTQCPNLTTPDE